MNTINNIPDTTTMNRIDNIPDTSTQQSAPDPATVDATDPAPSTGGVTAKLDPSTPDNDNAATAAGSAGELPARRPLPGAPDTTRFAAHPQFERSIRSTLARYRVRQQDMADAIADVRLEAIETARAGKMPQNLAQWKALATTIAVHRALNRLRRARQRGKYDAGLCEDADVYLSPTLHWEHRDPVDTKRYIAILEDLFRAGQMPEQGVEILEGEADGVPHEELAAELGVTTSVVRGRLFRMRAKFRAKLASLGMLTLLLVLFALLSPVGEVATPPPQPMPVAEPPPACSVPGWDAGTPPCPENRPDPSNEIAP